MQVISNPLVLILLSICSSICASPANIVRSGASDKSQLTRRWSDTTPFGTHTESIPHESETRTTLEEVILTYAGQSDEPGEALTTLIKNDQTCGAHNIPNWINAQGNRVDTTVKAAQEELDRVSAIDLLLNVGPQAAAALQSANSHLDIMYPPGKGFDKQRTFPMFEDWVISIATFSDIPGFAFSLESDRSGFEDQEHIAYSSKAARGVALTLIARHLLTLLRQQFTDPHDQFTPGQTNFNSTDALYMKTLLMVLADLVTQGNRFIMASGGYENKPSFDEVALASSDLANGLISGIGFSYRGGGNRMLTADDWAKKWSDRESCHVESQGVQGTVNTS